MRQCFPLPLAQGFLWFGCSIPYFPILSVSGEGGSVQLWCVCRVCSEPIFTSAKDNWEDLILTACFASSVSADAAMSVQQDSKKGNAATGEENMYVTVRWCEKVTLSFVITDMGVFLLFQPVLVCGDQLRVICDQQRCINANWLKLQKLRQLRSSPQWRSRRSRGERSLAIREQRFQNHAWTRWQAV